MTALSSECRAADRGHLAPFVAGRDEADRTRAFHADEKAVAGAPPHVVRVNLTIATR